jgi:hypothetical protein
MNQDQKPQPKKLDAIGLIIFLVAMTFTCISAFGEMWPTTKLIEWQAKIFDGSYYVKLTFLLTLLFYMLPMMGIYWLVKKLVKK